MKTMRIEKDFTSIGRKGTFAYDLPETDEEMLSDAGWGTAATCGHARANVMVYLRAKFESNVKRLVRKATGTSNKDADANFYRDVLDTTWEAAVSQAAAKMPSVQVTTPVRERLTEDEKAERATAGMSDEWWLEQAAKRGLAVKAKK